MEVAEVDFFPPRRFNRGLSVREILHVFVCRAIHFASKASVYSTKPATTRSCPEPVQLDGIFNSD
jgi:hypothetical protein